ncbi:hypothetical protein KOW79_001115 [Hemibagrus wyckioides]|uniref:Rho GTPase-activating protein 29/45 N-terminal domain-containing protein n=1 Tax=Hemibagrus wyckioides TaxID=337641 RepID=A0A9D3PCD9_9TELE|nr:hypothetical protein KOW79_001115 [Hemibagrus wyckioides]
MFAGGMLQQSSLGNKRSGVGITRISSSHFFPPGPGSGSRAGSIKSDSLSSISSDPEYIMQLVSDVRKFADVLLHLKEAFNSKEHQDCLHQVVHERLGELLRVLKCVIAKHPTLNSVDILTAAGTLIAKVKVMFLVGLQKAKALFSHHDGSVVFHKEEICTSCLGDVGFLCRRADSMVLPRMQCSSAVLLNGFALVERERLEVR